MSNAQRKALRDLFDSSESVADAIRAFAAFAEEKYTAFDAGDLVPAIGWTVESLGEAALHAESADAEIAEL